MKKYIIFLSIVLFAPLALASSDSVCNKKAQLNKITFNLSAERWVDTFTRKYKTFFVGHTRSWSNLKQPQSLFDHQ